MDAKQKLRELILASPSLADTGDADHHGYLHSLRAQCDALIDKLIAAHAPANEAQKRRELLNQTKNIQNRTRGRLGELLGRVALTQATPACDDDLQTDAISFETPHGKRRIDVYWAAQQLALETKMGYVTLSRQIRAQIEKDAFLLANGQLETVIWLLMKDGSPRLKELLTQQGIDYKIGWPKAQLKAKM